MLGCNRPLTGNGTPNLFSSAGITYNTGPILVKIQCLSCLVEQDIKHNGMGCHSLTQVVVWCTSFGPKSLNLRLILSKFCYMSLLANKQHE